MSSEKRMFDKVPCTKCGKRLKIERGGKSKKCPHCGVMNSGLVAMSFSDLDAIVKSGVPIEPARVQGPLTDAETTRVKGIYDAFGHLAEDSLEALELVFMKDHPAAREKEFESWEKAAAVYQDFMSRHPGTNADEQQRVANMLLLYTTDKPASVYAQLKEQIGPKQTPLLALLESVNNLVVELTTK